MEENNYCVYQHISPSNKSYFGIHKGNDVRKRWANGLGYRTQTVFFRAIVKYGWDNFQHKVLYKNLSEQEAKKKEKELINKYKTNASNKNHKNGYNMTPGGDTCPSMFFQEDKEYRKMMEENCYSKIRKPVDMYDIKGNYIKSFSSMRDAEKEIGAYKGEVSKCCHGERSNVKGYVFKEKGKKLEINDNDKLKLFKRQVYQFDFYGNLIRIFDSCANASKYVNFGSTKGASMIAHCAKGERASYKGYLWSYTDQAIMNPKRRPTRCSPVNMYDLDGNFIKTFESISAAKREVKPETKSLNSIIGCCRGKYHSAYGFIWKYAN